jgi:hypothetical protein
MRVRKKPDLRLVIPSYPHDYVEMPMETRRLILEANRTPNDIQYIDDDTATPSTSLNSPEALRSPTPEIKISGPDDDITLNKKEVKEPKEPEDISKDNSDSPEAVAGSRVLRNSISLPYGLKYFDEKQHLNKVSGQSYLCQDCN